MRNDTAVIISKIVDGSTVTEKETELFCERRSVRQSEFYAAYQVGLNPQYVLLFDPDDYNSAASTTDAPSKIRYNSKTYAIIRTYEKDNEIEVTIGLI